MVVSTPSRRLLLRENVRQFVLLVVLDERLDAHILQQLLRGLSVDGQTNWGGNTRPERQRNGNWPGGSR
jgi:hypothetical protein